MDTNTLKRLVGEKHYDEVAALLDENGKLPVKVSLRNPKVTLILAICLGLLGIDRLYQGGLKYFGCKLGMNIFSLGTWWLVDIGYAISMTQEVNYQKIMAANA